MKKVIMVLLFVMMLIAMKSSMVTNVCADLVEGEIYPDPYLVV